MIDPNSREWKEFEQIMRERLATHRTTNDNRDRNEVDTAFLRGRIAELKLLLGLAKPTPVPNTDE